MPEEANMSDALDRSLAALAAAPAPAGLDGMEDGVWSKLQARRAAAAAVGLRAAVTVAALAMGLAFGALRHPMPSPTPEMAVVSEDGLLAPSARLGGGA
jgi:hypothetical protein